MTGNFTGTAELPTALAFDMEALAREIGGAVPGLDGRARARKFKGGQSNPTFLLDTGERQFVLRRRPTGRTLDSAHRIDREARVMRALADTPVAVPEILFETQTSDVLGSPYYIMEYLDGRIFWDPTMKGADAEERGAVYGAMIDMLAALHSVDPASVGLEDFGPEANYFLRQTERWDTQYASAAGAAALPQMSRLADWLRDNLPATGRRTIIHGDFRLDNLVFARDSADVLGMIDWELSTLGDPLGDLSYLLLGWRIPLSPDGSPSIASVDPVALGIPTEAEVLDRYARATQREGVEGLDTLIVYNLFRLASILEGVAARGRQGNASSQRAETFGRMVAPLVAFAIGLSGLSN